MKRTSLLAVGAAFALGIAVSTPADAHGGRYYGGYGHGYRSSINFGFYYGGPAYWGWPGPAYYYPYPYYGYRPVVVAPAGPTTYIERGDSNTPPDQAQGYWYYCEAAQAYYPYVKQCAGGWKRVDPQPPG